MIKYLDLFTGYGGFTLGIQRAFGDNRESRPAPNGETSVTGHLPNPESGNEKGRQRATCIGFSEIDKYAIQVYEKHFGEKGDYRPDIRNRPTDIQKDCPDASEQQVRITSKAHKNYGDITKINPTELPDFDLLTGGFPCQAFSIAGKRKGFDDTRGTLFFDIARILKEKRPRNFILENVKGLLSHDNGRTFKTIITTLTELGYCVEWQVLNAKDFGVPQNRERVFIVGHLGGVPERKVFPIGASNEKDIVQLNNPAHSNNRLYGQDGISPTLNTAQGGNRQPKIPVLTPDRLVKRKNGRRMKTDGEPMFTLNTQDKHGIFNGAKIRRLTPKECERLMGLPDDWLRYGADGKEISDTQRYKLAGNGVVVNVVEAVVRKLYQS